MALLHANCSPYSEKTILTQDANEWDLIALSLHNVGNSPPALSPQTVNRNVHHSYGLLTQVIVNLGMVMIWQTNKKEGEEWLIYIGDAHPLSHTPLWTSNLSYVTHGFFSSSTFLWMSTPYKFHLEYTQMNQEAIQFIIIWYTNINTSKTIWRFSILTLCLKTQLWLKVRRGCMQLICINQE